MRRFVLIVTLILLCLASAALAEDSELPICTDGEFRAVFNTIVEHQLVFDVPVSNAGDLHRLSAALKEKRQSQLSDRPICAEALAIQKLLIQLSGDALARASLELADLPAGGNPYLLILPDPQARIEDLLSAMLGIDRTDAPAPAERELPSCDLAELSLLADAATAFLDIAPTDGEDAVPANLIDAIDRILRWREDEIPPLPLCAESIDLIHALSAAATDSSAANAFRYSGVSTERNPFPPLLEIGIASVTSWLDQWSTAAESRAASVSAPRAGKRQLPPCAAIDLPVAPLELQSEYAQLIALADANVDLLDFGAAQIAFRQNRLAQLPLCHEAFTLRWQTAEALADVSLRSAIKAGAPTSTIRILGATSADNEARATAAWETLASSLADEESGAAAPECDDADHIFLFSYLTPEFWEYADAALLISQPQDVSALIDQSYAFRQLLWNHLPRCDDALEIGLLMRAIAADTAAMLALELAGAPASEIPYLPKIAGDMERLFEWIAEFFTTCGGINGATTTYYVIAENIANVRACASTNCDIVTTASRGQRLDVVDDLSNWYEIVLPSCETAYIAGFLASQTPPG